MRIVFDRDVWLDYVAWQNEDAATAQRINALVEDARRHPFTGLGEPEPLKQSLKGWWSRRISGEHRLVYRVSGSGATQALEILSCRYHYR